MTTRRVVGIAAAMALSFVAGWFAHASVAEHTHRQVILSRSMERLTFAAEALSLVDSERPGRLEQLLGHGLDSALEAAEREVANGTRLPHDYDFPSLLSGLDRACSVAEVAGDFQTTARLKSLRSTLYALP